MVDSSEMEDGTVTADGSIVADGPVTAMAMADSDGGRFGNGDGSGSGKGEWSEIAGGRASGSSLGERLEGPAQFQQLNVVKCQHQELMPEQQPSRVDRKQRGEGPAATVYRKDWRGRRSHSHPVSVPAALLKLSWRQANVETHQSCYKGAERYQPQEFIVFTMTALAFAKQPQLHRRST